MSIPRPEQLKWIRKGNLIHTATPIVNQNYIVEKDYFSKPNVLTVGQFLGEREISDSIGRYRVNDFKDVYNNETFNVKSTMIKTVYEIPADIDTIIPPVPTQEDKNRFPTSEQLNWFRFGKRPDHEPADTEQYYLKANKTPEKNKYYLFMPKNSQQLKIGYLFNIFTSVHYGYAGSREETETEYKHYEFKCIDEESTEIVDTYDPIPPTIYDIPATLPTTPPPPLITGIYKRIVSIKIEKGNHELIFHDGTMYDISIKDIRDFNYIEVKDEILKIKNLSVLLTDPNNSISGTYVSLTEIQGTCSDGASIKKLFMKFDVTHQTKLLSVRSLTLQELKKVMDETDKLPKSKLEGLCSIMPPSEIVGPNQTELQELTFEVSQHLKEDENTLVKTYIVLGDYTCEVEVVSFTPKKTKYLETFNQGFEPYIVPQEIIVSSRVNQASISVDKVYIKKSDMDDINTYIDRIDIKEPGKSDIYYKPIEKDPKVGDTVFFYDIDKDNPLQGTVKSINKTGKVESYVVEYTDGQGKKTKNVPVSELYEIDKSRTITAGRRRKTRNIFKKKHSQNKRTSRIRNSLKRKSLNKRRQRRTRKYGRTHSRK